MTQSETQAHTPGPWRHHKEGSGWSFSAGQIAGPSNRLVGFIAGIRPWPRGEDEANAALIAAAPDLLAALATILGLLGTIEVLGEWEAEDSHVRQRAEERAKVDEAVDNARAAIAKARGS